ncbi:TPA: hypothetical protein PNO31_002007 [Enterococcus faecium]|nr:hypothetical protein [Enterococcus faecium]
MEETISLKEIFETLRKHLVIIIISMFAGLAISVNQAENSQMFSIQAISTNAVAAQQIANTTSQVFQENAKDVMNVDKISIISGAVANTTPVSPNNKLNLMTGLMLGMMVGVGLAFLLELLDRTVKDEKYVTDTLGFPILGTVPEMSAKELNAGIRKKGTAPARPKATNDKTAPSRRSRSRV